MATYRSWGEMYQDQAYARDWQCPHCGWAWMEDSEYLKYVVGFATELGRPPAFIGASSRVGGVIVECKRCFQKFWCHVIETMVQTMAIDDDRWPKSE